MNWNQHNVNCLLQNNLQALEVKLDQNRTSKGDVDSGCKNILSLKPKGEGKDPPPKKMKEGKKNLAAGKLL